MKKALTFLIALFIFLVWTTPTFALLEKEFFIGEVIAVNSPKQELTISAKDGEKKTFIFENIPLGEIWKGKEVLISSVKGSSVANSIMLTKYGE